MYTIFTDSCADLNPEFIKRYESLRILPLSYTMAGETHPDALGDEAKTHAFYERLRAGEACTTSQVSPAEFVEAYRPYVERGEPLLCLHFSSALSGTYMSACIARDQLLEEFPGAVIEVVDTLAASAGQGLLVYDALENRALGMSVEDNAKWVREHLQQLAHWFTVDDLHFLKRGGRCSPSAAFFGSMLSIKPVLHVSSEGKPIARSKVRGRKQALRALVSQFEALGGARDMVFISHGDCKEDAEFVAGELVERCGCNRENIVISLIGPVIGSHSGPGTVAVFFHGRDRG